MVTLVSKNAHWVKKLERQTLKFTTYEPTSWGYLVGLIVRVAWVEDFAQVKSPLIDVESKEGGFVGNVSVTVKSPQIWDDAEPETLSYQRPVKDEAGTKTDVVMEGNAVAVIVAVEQGLKK